MHHQNHPHPNMQHQGPPHQAMQHQSGPHPGNGAEGSANQEDLVDHFLVVDGVEKEVAKHTHHHFDPKKWRVFNEIVTDAARNVFQGMTGDNVPSNISN